MAITEKKWWTCGEKEERRKKVVGFVAQKGAGLLVAFPLRELS